MVAPTAARPVVGVFSLSGCGGNRLTLSRLEPALTRIVELRPDDFDVQTDIALVDGAVVDREDEEKLLAVRERSALLVALGTCAAHGGVAGADGAAQGATPARAIADVVAVDATVTGCPVEPGEVLASLAHLLHGDPPLPQTFPVCTECRIREVRCVLGDADAICLGPVTAAGCGARCPTFGIGCAGCRGPSRDANWTSALDLFTDRGSDPDDVVLKMRTFARAPLGRPRLHSVGSAAAEMAAGIPGTAARFERRIVGRGWDDVPGIVSRIDAGAAVAHSQTAIRTIERAFGVTPSAQTDDLRDLLWRGQSIAAHALALGPLARDAMDGSATDATRRLADIGTALKTGVGGHAVHALNALTGGFGRVPEERLLRALLRRLDEARHDVAALIDGMRALPRVPDLEAGAVHIALRQDERYRYDHGDHVIVLANDERRAVVAEALPKVLGEYTAPKFVGPAARLAINRDRIGALGTELLTELDVDPATPDATTHARARAIELAIDVERGRETVARILEAGSTAAPAPAVVPRAGLATTATEAPAGLLLYSLAFDPRGRIRTATILRPGARPRPQRGTDERVRSSR